MISTKMTAAKQVRSPFSTDAQPDQSAVGAHLLDLPGKRMGTGGPSANVTGGQSDPITACSPVSTPDKPFSTITDGVTGLPIQPATSPPVVDSADPSAALALYIVFLNDNATSERLGLSNRVQRLLGSQPADTLFQNLNGFTARLTPAQAKLLQGNPAVRGLEADQVVSLAQPIGQSNTATAARRGTSTQSTPYGVPMVWGSTNYSAANNSGKYAIVLDTGVSTQTGDLNVNSTYSRNFTSNNPFDWIDYNNHGTHVAGTIAAINDSDGVVGVAAGANIISIRVLDSKGSGLTSWITNGINYAAGLVKSGGLKGVAIQNLVANLSLGGGLNPTLDNAVRAAATPDGWGRYLRFAVAAGNSAADVDTISPANTGDHPNIYTVSAVNASRTQASFSNFDNIGDSIDDCDFSAPGVGVQSLGRTAGTLITMSGTSMASPHMAGALLMGTPLTSSPISTPVLAGAAGDPMVLLS